MPYGYNGKILHVNLNDLSYEIEEPSENFYRTYFGGGGLAAHYLLKDLKPGTDPLSPENILVFALSVLTGAPLSGFSRYTVSARSPLTGGFAETEAGGFFGPELKFSGYDAIVIKGKAPRPVYLWINNGNVEIRDASAIWGLENAETLDKIREQVGEPRARVASIGPAGERLVLVSTVSNELSHANGRTGMGAVMGSKNLKAIACRGDAKNISFADPEKVKELVSWHNKRIREHQPNINFSKFGTPMFVVALNNAGILPTRNFREGTFEGAEKIGVPGLEKILKRAGSCYRCAVACKRVVELDTPYRVHPRYGGPEYEALASLGSFCGIDDLAAVAKANEMCNRYGLDVIGTGAIIAFAMECFEQGILKESDADGRKVLFGDAEGMLWLVDKINKREGIGDILAQGVQRAAEKIGNGADQFAFTIKGQEIPMHDPRGKTGVGLSYALSPTGADHIETPHDVAFTGDGVNYIKPLGLLEPIDPVALDAAKVRFFRLGQLSWSMNNTLGICNFVAAPLLALKYEKIIEAVRAITGWETNLWEIMRATDRSQVMMRVFNNREGFGPQDDRLFRRLHEPLPSGPSKGNRIDEEELRNAIRLYYQMSGWDENGIPTKAKLLDLNLEWLPEAK
ncbi:MAG: aldehyde ferredoxin oxidoreductase family protein [Deltaproteobacteria bacterium]|nr:aldehyde ferredoxin oxidoreductase family protein [Deltaproteobacteria bacterium]MBW1960286.1 aldehyde ferredoxin oxidoreductase family protein [Deltaproteobacteria bacterium]MBW1995149.1 aldehyde ferredoxin oxidoreductase family protein [Deltaproteobacteria bacterium]MBW2150300.1 aldehyde ferredoxin oxidoreductase family protein [Deltaproteobacteria bacterium]